MSGACTTQHIGRTASNEKVKWEDNIKMDVRNIRCTGVNWTGVAQNTVMNIHVPYKQGKLMS